MPVQVSSGNGIRLFLCISKLKFWISADKIKNNEFRANVSPAQSRFPAPNGNDLSNLGENCPAASRNRSGLNNCGCSNVCSSWWAAFKAGTTTVPCFKRNQTNEIGSEINAFLTIVLLEYRSP